MATCKQILLSFSLIILIGTQVFIVNAQGNGAVEFYHSGQSSYLYSSGIVRIYYNGGWGNICYRNRTWGQSESDVVCHQMGWSGASSYSTALDSIGFGLDNLPTLLDHVNCLNSSYLVLLACSYTTVTVGDNYCNNLYDVAVSCYTTKIWQNMPYSGFLRLMEGRFVTEGRVEVYCNGQWGTVCDDHLGREEAATMCRQLGYTDYVLYDHLILPGNSSQPIWLDDVVCLQTQTCLASCQSCPSSENHNCRHGEDFTVACSYVGSLNIGATKDTCVDADLGPQSSSSNNRYLIVGVAVGGVIVFFIVIIFITIVCCFCRAHCSSEAQVEDNEPPEKISPVVEGPASAKQKARHPQPSSAEFSSSGARNMAMSPEIIMMDGSPRAIRRTPQPDPRYMTHPPPPVYIPSEQNTGFYPSNNYYSIVPSSTNPYYQSEYQEIDRPFVTTPPVFQGQPAPKFHHN